MTAHTSPWLTRDEVAARLRVAPKTLAQWAHQHKGPPFGKFGKHVRYRITDVEAWEQAQIIGGAA